MFGFLLQRGNKIDEALELVTSDVMRLDHSVATGCSIAFHDAIDLKVGIEVFFEGLVPDKAHAADCTLELNALKELCLGKNRRPKRMSLLGVCYLLCEGCWVVKRWGLKRLVLRRVLV